MVVERAGTRLARVGQLCRRYWIPGEPGQGRHVVHHRPGQRDVEMEERQPGVFEERLGPDRGRARTGQRQQPAEPPVALDR